MIHLQGPKIHAGPLSHCCDLHVLGRLSRTEPWLMLLVLLVTAVLFLPSQVKMSAVKEAK